MRWWFGQKAAGEPRPFLLRGWQGSAGAPWPQGYEAQLREAYVGNPVAQRAVRLVAESVAWAPVYAVEEGAGATPTAAGRSASPSRGELATPPLLEAAASQLLLHGNAYLQILLDAEGMPAELFALRPERVSIEAGPGGWPAAYRYKAGAAQSRLPARDGLGRPSLVHVKTHHPLDDHHGLGCLGAAAGAVAIHNAATRWNKALLDNAARPSGALSYDSGDGAVLSADQYARLKQEIEAEFQGAGNAGRPMLLEGGLSWQAMSLSPADMDFVGLKAAAAREIALAFGVPPMLLGLPGDATYANYREANRALWRLTVLPIADKLLRALSDALGAWWPGVRLAIDLDQVTALAEDRERLWRQVKGADFLSEAEKREMLGFAPVAARRGRGGSGMTDNAGMLARLMAQAEGQGADLVTLRALVEEASEVGAERALGLLGLGDGKARRDMDELRELLQAWRDAKRTAVRAALGWFVRIGLALLVLAMALKLGLMEMVR